MIRPNLTLPLSTSISLPPDYPHTYCFEASENEYYRSTASSVCSSPFPHSDSEDMEEDALEFVDLKLIIATTPETQLRAMMLKLARSNTQVRHAITKELQPPTPQIVAKPHRRSRRPRRRHRDSECPPSTCSNCSKDVSDGDCLDICVYHPGQLEDDVFEFLSKTPEGRVFKILKTVSMWSCCEDEPSSAGCVSAPIHVQGNPDDL